MIGCERCEIGDEEKVIEEFDGSRFMFMLEQGTIESCVI